jgi:hypothetical protein
LRRQKKETKEKAIQMPLASCASRIYRGLPERASLSFWQRAASLPHLFGLFPTNAPMLGAA